MPSEIRQLLSKRVRDQGERPTCVAFAVTACHEYWIDICCANKQSLDLDLSEEFLFYGCKARDGVKGRGTTIVAASETLVTDGECLEQLHPYRRTSSLISVPSQAAFADGKTRILKTLVRRTMDLKTVRDSLNKNMPVVAAIELFKNAYRAGPTGSLRMPAKNEKAVGKHAIVIVDLEVTGTEEHLIFVNSWGQKWGEGGVGRFSAQYFAAHCKQLWNVEVKKETK